jgi:16S rRNA G966 N2-methylase RsmD
MLLEIWYDENHFYVEDNTARPDKKPSGVEKQRVNEIVAADHEWNFVLDAFAGYGISSYIFSKHARKVLALEKRELSFDILWQNVRHIENIVVRHTNNVRFLEKALKEGIEPPDLIDLDPYGNCREQLPLALDWMKKGAILITSGEIEGITRNSPFGRKNFPELEGRYIGKEAVMWAEKEFIPNLLKQYDLRLVHFYAEPSSVRTVFKVGGFEFQEETKEKLANRPKYIDWFKDCAPINADGGNDENHDKN